MSNGQAWRPETAAALAAAEIDRLTERTAGSGIERLESDRIDETTQSLNRCCHKGC
jgi:hypothetical protein